MIKAKKLLLVMGLAVIAGGSLVAISAPSSASAVKLTASSTVADCSQRFLTFPTWFRDMVEIKETTPGKFECVILSPDAVGGLGSFIGHIALNILEMALQLVAYLTAGFILLGGFQFLTSQGSPDEAAKARQTIINAAIGLIISMAAIAATNLISGILIVNP
jgi:hypothetical protein